MSALGLAGMKYEQSNRGHYDESKGNRSTGGYAASQPTRN